MKKWSEIYEENFEDYDVCGKVEKAFLEANICEDIIEKIIDEAYYHHEYLMEECGHTENFMDDMKSIINDLQEKTKWKEFYES